MPPGHVLSELGKESFPEVKTLAIGERSLRETLDIAPRYANAGEYEQRRSN
jgi:hypothetical protein